MSNKCLIKLIVFKQIFEPQETLPTSRTIGDDPNLI